MTGTQFSVAVWVDVCSVRVAMNGAAAPHSHAAEAGCTAAAVASDLFYVPGKAIVCGASGVLSVVTMALTFATLYQGSADFVRGACGGTWVLTGEDIKPAQSY